MKDIFAQIQEKVTKAVISLSKHIENEQVNKLPERFLIADYKNGLIVVEKMFGHLIEMYSDG